MAWTNVSQQHLVPDGNGFCHRRIHRPQHAHPVFNEVVINGPSHESLHRCVTLDLLRFPNRRLPYTHYRRPLYQPGQIAHFRLLALDQRGHARATSNSLSTSATPTTRSSSHQATTSHFGVAPADWAVPARLRLGDYSVSARRPRSGNVSMTAEPRSTSPLRPPQLHRPAQPDKPFSLPGRTPLSKLRAEYLSADPSSMATSAWSARPTAEWNLKSRNTTPWKARCVGRVRLRRKLHGACAISPRMKDYRGPRPGDDAFTDLHLAAYVTDDSTRPHQQRRFDLRVTASRSTSTSSAMPARPKTSHSGVHLRHSRRRPYRARRACRSRAAPCASSSSKETLDPRRTCRPPWPRFQHQRLWPRAARHYPPTTGS